MSLMNKLRRMMGRETRRGIFDLDPWRITKRVEKGIFKKSIDSGEIVFFPNKYVYPELRRQCYAEDRWDAYLKMTKQVNDLFWLKRHAMSLYAYVSFGGMRITKKDLIEIENKLSMEGKAIDWNRPLDEPIGMQQDVMSQFRTKQIDSDTHRASG